MTMRADQPTEVTLKAGDNDKLRMIWIEVPTQVAYPLYPKR